MPVTTPQKVKINLQKILKLSALFLFALLTSSCSTSSKMRHDYLVSYQSLNFEKAHEGIDRSLKKGEKSGDAPTLYLDRATVQFAEGKSSAAVGSYQKALESIDYYSQQLVSEEVGKYLAEDQVAAYPGEDFEQVLARVYFALALFQNGDPSNGRALLKQAEEETQKKAELYHNCGDQNSLPLLENSLAKYLFATVLEKEGDFSNASILYDQSGYLGCSNLSPESSHCPTVLICCHRGLAPYKVTERATETVLTTLALEDISTEFNLKNRMIGITGLPIPALVDWSKHYPPQLQVAIDQKPYWLTSVYDVGEVSRKQFEKNLPSVVARSFVRYGTRKGAIEAVDRKDPHVADALDLAFSLWSLSSEAETRSWGTLPGVVDLGRFDLSPGEHTLSFQVGPNTFQTETIDLKENDLCIINLFYPKEGHLSILIPSSFIHKSNL